MGVCSVCDYGCLIADSSVRRVAAGVLFIGMCVCVRAHVAYSCGGGVVCYVA